MLAQPAGDLTSAATIASQLNGSATYVSKVLQELVRSGILGSKKGAQGGFYLLRPPAEVTLWDVIAPFEEFDDDRCAIDGGGVCCDSANCGMHDFWSSMQRQIVAKLRATTLRDLHRSYPTLTSISTRTSTQT